MASLFPLGDQTHLIAANYVVHQELGEGRFSTVYKAFDKRNARDVALKVYCNADKDAWDRSDVEKDRLKKVSGLNSPFFPKFIQSIKTLIKATNHPVLVLELAEYHDSKASLKSILTLQEVLRGIQMTPPDPVHGPFWEAENVRDFCLDMCQAVAELHSLGIIHRDIKPANILLKRSAGSPRSSPFIVDFNAISDPSSKSAGTKDYLPPEVVAGLCEEASDRDDLWAVCRVIWELYHGIGAAADSSGISVHGLIKTPPPEEVLVVLRKALSMNPKDRFSDAYALSEALGTVFNCSDSPKLPGEEPREEPEKEKGNNRSGDVTRDDISKVRQSAERIRDSIIYTLETGDGPPVPKEVREIVALAMETSEDGSITAIDLRTDLIDLGKKAFPAILEQCYKLHDYNGDWTLARQALVKLAQDDRSFADESLSYYSVSSAYAVRRMCLDVCEDLEWVPAELLDLLNSDDGLLGHEERRRLLNHIFAYASDDDALLSLVLYMTNAVIQNDARFPDLRDSIARRLHELPTTQLAQCLFEDAQNKVWENGDAYNRSDPQKKNELALTATRLLSEAFVTLPGAVKNLSALYPAGVKKPKSWDFIVWIEFLKATMTCFPESRDKFTALANHHNDTFLMQEIDKLLAREPIPTDQIPGLVRAYISGGDTSRSTFNKLRFDPGAVVGELNKLLNAEINGEVCQGALKLLEGFESRKRKDVVKCTLENWQMFKSYDLELTCKILSQSNIYDPNLRQDVKSILSNELQINPKDCVRIALDRILGEP